MIGTAPGPRAAIYTRVSTQEQGQRGYSLGAQEADGRHLADELGAEVVAVYSDQDSGASWDLPGLNALLDAAKRREFDTLVVYDPDRLARNMAKQLVLEEELKRAGVAIRYCTLRLGDTAEDRLLKNMRSSIAEYEREKIALRTSRGRRAKAERGEYVGSGRVPFGYRAIRQTDPRTGKGRIVGLEPDPATAPIVAHIFAEARHLSLAALVLTLNNAQVPAPSARGWTVVTLRHLLHNPTYKGEAPYGRHDGQGRVRAAEAWLTVAVPALIRAEVWDAVQAAMAARYLGRRVRRSPEEDPYILREALRCGHCGGALACTDIHGRGRFTYRYYVCLRTRPRLARVRGVARCTLPAIPAALLEAATWERIGELLLDPERLRVGLAAGREQHDTAAEAWQARRQTVEREIVQRRQKLTDLVADRADAPRGSETRAALDRLITEHEGAIARLGAELTQLAPRDLPGLSAEAAEALETFAAEVRAGLTAATPPEQRRICELLQVLGTVREDPEHGMAIGRHPFSIHYKAALPLMHNGSNFQKLGADNRAQAVAIAAERGLL